MRVLVDLGHPAHVHLFRPVIAAWQRQGHTCQVVARDKDITLHLLQAYGIPYLILAPLRRGLAGLMVELLQREYRMYVLGRRWRPHLIIGTSVNAARVARYLGAKSIIMNEDDARSVPLFRWLAYPLASAIVTPQVLAYENYGPRHLTYPGYHELFYLHPQRFQADPHVIHSLRRQGRPYAVIRLSALQAHHDRGIKGLSISLLQQLIQALKSRMWLYISSEKPLHPVLEPYRFPIAPETMHHALAGAEFFLGDSQTMTMEAALLGIPALRLNDFVGRIPCLTQLESWGLAFGFKPGQESHLRQTLLALLAQPDYKKQFQQRRQLLLSRCQDPLPWLLQVSRMLVAGMAYRHIRQVAAYPNLFPGIGS